MGSHIEIMDLIMKVNLLKYSLPHFQILLRRFSSLGVFRIEFTCIIHYHPPPLKGNNNGEIRVSITLAGNWEDFSTANTLIQAHL